MNKIQLGIALALPLAATHAMAWDCTNPANYYDNAPGNECYMKGAAPTFASAAPVSSAGAGASSTSTSGAGASSTAATGPVKSTSNASQGQGQGQGQGQRQSASARGGNATTGASTSALNQSSQETNSGNYTYREAANVVQPATMIIQGCQVQGQVGGSNTRAAAMLGIGFTPAQCYDYIQAQAYLAIDSKQAACEVLNHTPAAERAIRNGAKLPDCAPPVIVAPPVVQAPVFTSDQVTAIVAKALRK